MTEGYDHCAIPLSRTARKGRYAATLLAVSLVAFLGVVLVNLVAGRSLVWNTDGRLLYYPFMIEEGEWLRGIVASLLAGDLTIPSYSFNYGFGADWLVAASGNSNEPLNLLSALCPRELSEYFYGFLVFLRFYLAMLAFSLYCFSRGKGKAQTLCGAVAYGLCGYIVFWGVLRHPNFVDFAVLLPLVFMGADKLFARKRPFLLIASMAGIFVYSIYFAYMACFFLLFYCLIAYFAYPRERSVSDFALLALKFLVCIAVAFCLVGFSTFPMFITLTSMGRVGVVRDIAFFHDPEFYLQFASLLLGTHTTQNAAVLGAVPVVAVLALLVAGPSVGRRERIGWSIGIALCLLGAFVSKVGSVLNGFGYSTDRWLLILGFCAAYAVVLVVPAFGRFSRKQWCRLTALVGAVALWALAYAVYERTILSVCALAMFVLIFSCLLLWAAVRPRRCEEAKSSGKVAAFLLSSRGLSVLLIAAMIANTTVYTGLFMSPLGSSYYKEFIRAGHGLSTREQLDLSEALDYVDERYRIDRPDTTYGRNGSFFHGYKGMDFYSSFYNQAVDDFRQSLGLADDVKSTMFDGVQQRTALEALLGGKYYVASNEAEDEVPAGYVKVADLGEAHNGLTYSLYETDFALPLAFVYDSWVPQAFYDELNLVERQELLTQSVVLPDDEEVPEDFSGATETQEVEVAECDGVVVEDGRFIVEKEGGSVTLSLNGRAQCENYLCFEGLTLDPMTETQMHELLGGEPLAEIDDEDSAFDIPYTGTWITVSGAGKSTSFEIVTSANAKYAGKDAWAVNLGFSEQPVNSVEVSFGGIGVYECESVYGASQPMAAIEENIERLRETNGASISFGVNSMTFDVDAALGDAEARDSRFVFVSVPYSSGWSATIDGETAEVLRANVGFMAVEVDGGAHRVEFHYVTPGLVPGAACSLVAAAGLTAFWIVVRRRQRNVVSARSEEKELG